MRHRYLIIILGTLVCLLVAQRLLLSSQDELSSQNRHKAGGASGHAVRPTSPARFVDATIAAGLSYTWSLPGKIPRNILQTIGNGCAFLDYNRDGNLDILLIGPRLALYQGDGHGHFTDVTHQVGLDSFHGNYLGCAVGDYDNDGYEDIFISGYRCALLLHNEHGKRFRDVTRQSGIQPGSWSTSAAWADIDGDGKLDLFVCNYVEFRPENARFCSSSGIQSACGPLYYHPESCVLYHNEGSGRFTNATHLWGLDDLPGRSLGIAFADFNGSGHQSLFVASDQVPSSLLLNTSRYFTNIARSAGVATDEGGHAIAGMGADWGDYDNDGKLDLAVMDFAGENKRILHNEGNLGNSGNIGNIAGNTVFFDRSVPLGLHTDSFPLVAFGTKWLDYDNDGWLDLIIANGHTADNIAMTLPTQQFLQPTLLYHNERGEQFANASQGLVGPAGRRILGRGLAVGDYDNDGKMDILIVDSAGSPLLLHNETPAAGHWLQVRLIGTKSNRDGFGALVSVRAGSLNLLRQCQSNGSYLSASDSRLHFGLAGETMVQSLAVRWPSGHVDQLHRLPADRIITILEGKEAKGRLER